MNINTNSWHYKLYRASYYNPLMVPGHTNLCQYTRRLVFGTLGLTVMFAVVAIITVFYYLLTPFVLLFGYAPFKNMWGEHGMSDLYWKYPGLKTGWFTWYPYHLLILAGIVAWEWYCATSFHAFLWAELTAVGVVVLLFAVAVSFDMAGKNETVKLAGAWMSARKQQVCPTITFSGNETETKP